MTQKISITIDDETLEFIDARTNNRSQFINALILQEKDKVLRAELKNAYIEQSLDSEFQQEVATWDEAVGDGIA